MLHLFQHDFAANKLFHFSAFATPTLFSLLPWGANHSIAGALIFSPAGNRQGRGRGRKKV